MVPPTPSTAVTGLSSPVAVTMTVSPELADAAGTPAIDVPASAAITAAPAAAIRHAFRLFRSFGLFRLFRLFEAVSGSLRLRLMT